MFFGGDFGGGFPGMGGMPGGGGGRRPHRPNEKPEIKDVGLSLSQPRDSSQLMTFAIFLTAGILQDIGCRKNFWRQSCEEGVS